MNCNKQIGVIFLFFFLFLIGDMWYHRQLYILHTVLAFCLGIGVIGGFFVPTTKLEGHNKSRQE